VLARQPGTRCFPSHSPTDKPGLSANSLLGFDTYWDLGFLSVKLFINYYHAEDAPALMSD
jgi:hypothetical protein